MTRAKQKNENKTLTDELDTEPTTRADGAPAGDWPPLGQALTGSCLVGSVWQASFIGEEALPVPGAERSIFLILCGRWVYPRASASAESFL